MGNLNAPIVGQASRMLVRISRNRFREENFPIKRIRSGSKFSFYSVTPMELSPLTTVLSSLTFRLRAVHQLTVETSASFAPQEKSQFLLCLLALIYSLKLLFFHDRSATCDVHEMPMALPFAIIVDCINPFRLETRALGGLRPLNYWIVVNALSCKIQLQVSRKHTQTWQSISNVEREAA